jgi:hypothetical protein
MTLGFYRMRYCGGPARKEEDAKDRTGHRDRTVDFAWRGAGLGVGGVADALLWGVAYANFLLTGCLLGWLLARLNRHSSLI